MQLKHPFGVAGNTRNSTPIVLIEIEHDGLIGYGEGSLPPYLGETQESVISFLKGLDISKFDSPLDIPSILNYVDALKPGNTAAKAAVDIALHDLCGKLLKKSWHGLIGAKQENMPDNCITLGIDSSEMIIKKLEETKDFNVLKIKLGGQNDREIVETVRRFNDKPLLIDVNQGWKEKEDALEMIQWLSDKNVKMIEQPIPKGNLKDVHWIRERSEIPLIADEDFQRLGDLERIAEAYDGINIKLMKCTGMYEAYAIIQKARSMGLKIMMGSMNESSCANMAAAQLAPLCDWVDLDGPFLITNNPFEDPVMEKGKIVLSDAPGIGVMKKDQE